MYKIHGIESLKYVRAFYTPVCFCGDVSTPRNVTMNETNCDWLFDMDLGQWKLPWIPDLQPSVWKSGYSSLDYMFPWETISYFAKYLHSLAKVLRSYYTLCLILQNICILLRSSKKCILQNICCSPWKMCHHAKYLPSLTNILCSSKKLCIILQNISILSQKYFVLLRKCVFLQNMCSLAKALCFQRNVILQNIYLAKVLHSCY